MIFFLIFLNFSPFNLKGSFHMQEGYISNPSADRITGDKSFSQFRFRIEPSFSFSTSLTFYFSMDVASNIYFGGTGYDPHDSPVTYNLRRAYLFFFTPFGVFEMGRMPNDWGMGILVNGGDKYDDVFGINRYGDSIDRIIFATKPLGPRSPLIVAAGYDKVSEEKIYSSGDDADDWLGVIFYDGEKIKTGSYFLARVQRSTHTLLFIPDIYGKITLRDGFGIFLDSFTFSFEGAMISGRTQSAPPVIGEDLKRKILSFGCVGRISLRKTFMEFNLESGFASGDANPAGGDITSFTFNPDYNVGLLMFEESLALLTFNSREGILRNVGRAPEIELFSTKGGFTNGIYFFPYVNFFAGNFKITGAFLYAIALRKFVDPYMSLIYSGGSPVGFDGGAPGKNYGYEIDGGVEWRMSEKVLLKAESGIFFPGNVFGENAGRVSGANVYLIIEF